MINLKTGDIGPDVGEYIVGRSIDRMQFEKMNEAYIRKIWDVGNGYIWFYSSDQIINGEKFMLAVCYRPDQKLGRIQLSIITSKHANSWEEWDEQKEREIKVLQDKWLLENFNIVEGKTFNWGTIKSLYDDKSGSSYISIKYI